MSGMSKDKAEKLAEKLNMVVGQTNLKEDVTVAEVEFEKIRNVVTSMLAALSPEDYEEYRKIKYADFEPTMESRRAAYKFAFGKLIDKVYTKTFS